MTQHSALETAKCYELAEKAKKSKQNTPNLFDAIVLATAGIADKTSEKLIK